MFAVFAKIAIVLFPVRAFSYSTYADNCSSSDFVKLGFVSISTVILSLTKRISSFSNARPALLRIGTKVNDAAVKENDIPDIIERFHNRDKETKRARTEQSFFVEKADIVSNDYDLSINKYKQTECVRVEYAPTKEILKDIQNLEREIVQGLAELEEMLK